MKSALGLLLFLILSITSACAANETYVSIQVLYLTDRAASAKGFDSQRKIEDGESIYNVNCGTARYSLRASALTESERKLGWSESQKANVLVTTPLPGSGSKSAYSDFADVIKSSSASSGCDDVFVIVHGYNTTFAGAVQSAAQLAYASHKPVIVYDWPSKGRAGQYDVDAGNNEWSQEHFDQLIDQLSLLKGSGIKFHLLAHSMGNRLAVRSSPVLKGKHLFDQIFLVDPDFDAETFVHYMSRYGRITEENRLSDLEQGLKAPKVRILFSHRDHALPLSQFLYGGYTRLGQAADSMLTSVFSFSAFSNMIDQANSIIGGNNCVKGKNDLRPDGMMQFDWIDFTALDHGIIGHTIPYKLIANLAESNQPGDGLKLVESENGKVNKLSQLSFGFHEKKHISARIGRCQRVVLLPRASSM